MANSVTTGTVNNGGVGTIGTLKNTFGGGVDGGGQRVETRRNPGRIVSIDNIGGCSLSENQFCLAGVMQCSGATTMNLNADQLER